MTRFARCNVSPQHPVNILMKTPAESQSLELCVLHVLTLPLVYNFYAIRIHMHCRLCTLTYLVILFLLVTVHVARFLACYPAPFGHYLRQVFLILSPCPWLPTVCIPSTYYPLSHMPSLCLSPMVPIEWFCNVLRLHYPYAILTAGVPGHTGWEEDIYKAVWIIVPVVVE
ncbi:hypothetical protein BKA83DRAFT_4131037 [Pisolithus microcarpus]|nr:hypothetical protein BKA83DRAFT_4131037 [Pisolithus microcarpus]